MTKLRETGASGQADDALLGVRASLNRANEAEAKQAGAGAAMIRKEIPPLVGIFLASYEDVRSAYIELELETEGGEAFRPFNLELFDINRQMLSDFRVDLVAVFFPEAAASYLKSNNELGTRQAELLEEALAEMPAQEREAFLQAIDELFGPGLGN